MDRIWVTAVPGTRTRCGAVLRYAAGTAGCGRDTAANLLYTVIRMEPCRPEEHPGGAVTLIRASLSAARDGKLIERRRGTGQSLS
eukprot:72363-Hanusia_phi.AAC.1